MANWWDEAPLVEKPRNWWEAAPLVEEPQEGPRTKYQQAELTVQQRRAIALARARRRRMQQGQPIEVELPDGSIAEFPAGTPQETILAAVRNYQGTAQQQPGIVGDVAASGAAGLARGTADLVGTPGLLKGIADLGGYLSGVGRSIMPESMGPMFDMQDRALGAVHGVTDHIPTGDTIQHGMSAVTGGATDYQPQTTAGEYARTIGQFAPAALTATTGAGGVSNILRYGVVPALTSETAGQLTKGTALETPARIGGALLGGAAGGMGRGQAAKPPSAASIRESAGYRQLSEHMKQAHVDRATYQRIVRDLWTDAQDFGLTPDLQRQFGGTLRNFLDRSRAGGASLHDLELLRRSLRNAAGNATDTPGRALSARLIGKLDDAVDALTSANIAASGQTGRPVLDVLKEARAAYRTGMKAQIVEDAISNAQQTASGVENGLRIEFRKILRNKRLASQFNATERTAMEQISKGTFTTNALRWLGTFGVPIDQGRQAMGSLMGGGTGAAIGGMIAGPAGAAIGGPLAMGVGTASKFGAQRMMNNQADLIDAVVKAGQGGSNLLQAHRNTAATEAVQRVLRALLQSEQAAQHRGNPALKQRIIEAITGGSLAGANR